MKGSFEGIKLLQISFVKPTKARALASSGLFPYVRRFDIASNCEGFDPLSSVRLFRATLSAKISTSRYLMLCWRESDSRVSPEVVFEVKFSDET